MKENRQAYIYGNAVREAVPVPKPSETEKKRKKKVSKKQRAAQIQYERVQKRITYFHRAIVIVGIVVMGTAFVTYLEMQTELTSRKSSVTSLQIQLENLQKENDAAKSAIERQVNLEYIKQRAVELGMVYPEDNQIVEYKSTNSNYIKQYENIPESGVVK